MCEDKELLESLRYILEDLEEFKMDANPIKVDGTLCVKCRNRLAGFCIELMIDCPYTKHCDKYKFKVNKGNKNGKREI